MKQTIIKLSNGKNLRIDEGSSVWVTLPEGVHLFADASEITICKNRKNIQKEEFGIWDTYKIKERDERPYDEFISELKNELVLK